MKKHWTPIYVFIMIYLWLMGMSLASTRCMDWYLSTAICLFALLITFAGSLYLWKDKSDDP